MLLLVAVVMVMWCSSLNGLMKWRVMVALGMVLVSWYYSGDGGSEIVDMVAELNIMLEVVFCDDDIGCSAVLLV